MDSRLASREFKTVHMRAHPVDKIITSGSVSDSMLEVVHLQVLTFPEHPIGTAFP